MKKINVLVLFLVLSTTILQGVNVYLSNRLAANSIDASTLQKKISALNEQNQILETKILEASSLEHIASKAASLGFVSNSKNYISLYSPLEVAITR